MRVTKIELDQYMRTMCTRVRRILVNDSLAAWHSKQYARNTRNTCCVLLRTRTRIRAVFFRRHPCRINNNNKYMYLYTYVCDFFIFLYTRIQASKIRLCANIEKA